MSFLNKILKGFLGDKNANDLKEVKKVVSKVKATEEAIGKLSDEELRGKTAQFKEKIKASSAKITEKIQEIQQKIQASQDVDEKEALFNKITELNKEAYQAEEKVLSDILPEAFAVVKETAKRWATNGEIRVKANDWD